MSSSVTVLSSGRGVTEVNVVSEGAGASGEEGTMPVSL